MPEITQKLQANTQLIIQLH